MPNYTKQCKELLLDDVVEIAVFDDKDIPWPHPKCIRVIESAVSVPEPKFVMSMKEGEAIYVSETPMLEIETDLKVYGKSYSYKLTTTSLYNIKEMDNEATKLDGKDVTFMLTRYDGTKEIVCPLNGTTAIKYKQSGDTPAKGSLEISCQSQSPLIKLS